MNELNAKELADELIDHLEEIEKISFQLKNTGIVISEITYNDFRWTVDLLEGIFSIADCLEKEAAETGGGGLDFDRHREFRYRYVVFEEYPKEYKSIFYD